jgi:hypothetical protein
MQSRRGFLSKSNKLGVGKELSSLGRLVFDQYAGENVFLGSFPKFGAVGSLKYLKPFQIGPVLRMFWFLGFVHRPEF